MKRTITAAVILILYGVGTPATFQPPGSWRDHRDQRSGITFRYPPDLQVTSSAHASGIDGWLSTVTITSNDEPSSLLSMTVRACDDVDATPIVPCRDETWYRQVCHAFKRLRIGDAVGFQCVSFGSAACHWSAYVLMPGREVRLMAPRENSRANERASTRETCTAGVVEIPRSSPVAEILATFRFR